jgi:modulator of FtsH protease HflC
MRAFLSGLLLLLGAAAAAVYFSFFIVHQNEQALVLEFGKPKRVIDRAGLAWKIPVVETVEYFDKRILDLETKAQEVFSQDQNKLIVDSFARYKIVDPLKYFQTLRNERGVQSRLGPILDSSLRGVLASATLMEAVRDKREMLMGQIKTQLNAQAGGFGIEVIDVRIKRTDLPRQNSESIYGRMKSDREREAFELRAQGEEQSRRIRASADRQVTVLRAEAMRDGEKVRGEGDAERNKIFADAYNRDAEFFGFYRSMQAYENSMKAGDTRFVVSPDSDMFKSFFKYFSEPNQSAPAKK